MEYIMYKDHKGEYRWRLEAKNGEIVADSGGDGYVKKSDCTHGIDLVKGSNAAPVKDNT
jgi:uncharacterized protein